jgi:hypothetical protein
MHPVDLNKLTPPERIVGDDAEETGLLQQMLQKATDYLKSFRWCPPIEQIYLGCGVGGVVAVFLFHFRERIQGTDEWLWVVVGDLPSAYLPTIRSRLWRGTVGSWRIGPTRFWRASLSMRSSRSRRSLRRTMPGAFSRGQTSSGRDCFRTGAPSGRRGRNQRNPGIVPRKEAAGLR